MGSPHQNTTINSGSFALFGREINNSAGVALAADDCSGYCGKDTVVAVGVATMKES